MRQLYELVGSSHAALKFALVGGIGFCVDSSLMLLLYDRRTPGPESSLSCARRR